MSTVVSGCLIAWAPLGAVNAGYVQAWATKNLAAWDCGVERRAGNIDVAASWSSQHFVVTSYSSLMALIGTVVFQYKTTGSIDPSLCKAFTSIRLLLFMDASRDEILAPAPLWVVPARLVASSTWSDGMVSCTPAAKVQSGSVGPTGDGVGPEGGRRIWQHSGGQGAQSSGERGAVRAQAPQRDGQRGRHRPVHEHDETQGEPPGLR